MQKKLILTILIVLILIFTTAAVVSADPLSTSEFTYQGQLSYMSELADGSFDFQFSLYSASSGGTQIGSTNSLSGVTVSEGLFTVQLDFGSSAFDGNARWLEIGVRPSGGGAYTTLAPRQEITPTPYAVFSGSAESANNAVDFSGSLSGDVSGPQSATVVEALHGYNLASTAPTDGQALVWNNTTSAWEPTSLSASGGYWSLAGNNGTTFGTDFLGTTDNTALDFRVNNVSVLRLIPNADSPNIIGGYSGNSIDAGRYGGVIAGGGDAGNINIITGTGDYATIGGGRGNTARGYTSTINGGWNNTASGFIATVSGGAGNTASSEFTTLGGGAENTASGEYATLSGGVQNIASGNGATVGGGQSNTASGNNATVPGGQDNNALGNFSFAAGNHATATNPGCFVWSDNSDNTNAVDCITDYQTIFKSSGGFTIYTASNLTTGVTLAPGGGSWTSVSDVNKKENFQSVDTAEVLESVLNMPVTTWNYITQEENIRHIGPMAQDFYAAFGVGETNLGITAIDADGVALAAIQGMYEVVEEKDARISELEAENADLNARLESIEDYLSESGYTPPADNGTDFSVTLPWLLLAIVSAAAVGFYFTPKYKAGK